MFRRLVAFVLLSALLLCSSGSLAEERILSPAWPVPEYVTHLLEVASGEVGYREDHGRTKYGAWAGDSAAQWCAEFLCWCVDQVDQRWGTSLLRSAYPYYTSSNTGKNWFIREGRWVVRKGQVEGWGYQWLKGSSAFIQPGDYVPQPGDWVFFNWGGGSDTEHVAMVEFCSEDLLTGTVSIHVIEGNNPSSVARAVYPLKSSSIIGYGAVHDVADLTMSFGNQGKKVLALQDKLAYLGLLDSGQVTGRFGDATVEAVRDYQASRGLRVTGIANIETQLALEKEDTQSYEEDAAIWTVVDDDD